MDSYRYDGNAIHIIGGDDKQVSLTENEYGMPSGGLAKEDKDLLAKPRESFLVPPCGENTDRTLRHCKKFYTEEGCPFGDSCNNVHDLESKYRESTTIVLSGGGSSSMKRVGRDTSAVPPVATPPLTQPRSAAPTSPLAPQPLPAAEADATVKPFNWRTRICMKWEYSGNCRFGNKCAFAHGETELRRYGGALVNPPSQRSNVPNTIAASGSSFAVGGGSGKLQGSEKRSGQTMWKFPKKIKGIYGDWIDDNE